MLCRLVTYVSLVAFMAVSSHSWLAAEPVFMGNITSVYADSDYNALRNPALIILQKSTSCLGIELASMAVDVPDITASYWASGSTPYFTEDELDYYAGGMAVSFTMRFNTWALGFGLTDQGSGLVQHTVDEMIKYRPSDGFTMTNKYDMTVFSPLLHFSLSRRIGGRHSIGFTISPGWSFQNVSWQYNGSGAGVNVETQTETAINTYSISATGGYCYRVDGLQVGLMANTGRLCLENTDASGDYYDYVTPANNRSGSRELRNDPRVQAAAGLTAGIYYRLFRWLALAAEGSFTIPARYDCDLLAFKSAGYFEIYNHQMTQGFGFSCRFGMEFLVFRDMVISIGGAYWRSSLEDEYKDKVKTTGCHTFMATAGIDYRITDEIKLIGGFVLALNYTSIDVEGSTEGSTFENNEVRMDVILGVSFAFYDANYHLDPREE